MSITTMEQLVGVPDGTVVRTGQGRWTKQGEVFTRGPEGSAYNVPLSYFADALTTGLTIIDPNSHLGVGEMVNDVADLEALPHGTVVFITSVGYWTKAADREETWLYRDGDGGTMYTSQRLKDSYQPGTISVKVLPAPPMNEGDVLTTAAQFAGLKVGSVVRTEGGPYAKEGENRWVKGASEFTDEEMTRFGSDVTLESKVVHAVGDHMTSARVLDSLPNRSLVESGNYQWRKSGGQWLRTSDHRNTNSTSISRLTTEIFLREVGVPRDDGLVDEGTNVYKDDEVYRALPTGTFLYCNIYGDHLVKIGDGLYTYQGTPNTRASSMRIDAYAERSDDTQERVARENEALAPRVARELNDVLARHTDVEPEVSRDLVQAMERLGLPHERTLVARAVVVDVEGTTNLDTTALAQLVGDVDMTDVGSIDWTAELRIPREVEGDVCACDLVSRRDVEAALTSMGVSWSGFSYERYCESGDCDQV